jgi:Cu-processing system permease protein
MGVLLFVTTEVLFRFGGDPSKTITSLMNVVLLVLPLVCLVLGTAHFYNSREFNELLLAQPMNRSSLYLGKLAGFTAALSVVFVFGTGLPFLIHSFTPGIYAAKLVTLLIVGILFIVIFSAVGFLVATRFDDKIKGLGSVFLLWFFLSVVYDGTVLLFIHLFRDYPYETPIILIMMANPVDLGRILIILQMDLPSLMGYTGAVFREFFGSGQGTVVSAAVLLAYAGLFTGLGLRAFNRKDL